MASAIPNLDRKYTVDEYFDLRDKTEGRLEYHDGKIRFMSGGTISHSRIKSDLQRVLGNAVLNGPCEPLDSDMAIQVDAFSSFLLPDISFLCDEPVFGDEGERRLLNPSLLIEVLSDSTGEYDRGEKFWKYRSIPSFREYVLVDSRRYAVECWFKEDDKIWRIDSAFSRSETVYLHTLKVELSLEEVYRRVFFDD